MMAIWVGPMNMPKKAKAIKPLPQPSFSGLSLTAERNSFQHPKFASS
jgi:hypothetical protein